MRDEFDKLLLTGLVILFVGLTWLGYHDGTAAAGLSGFASDQAKEFGGALLGLITGQAFRMRGKSSAPEPAKAPDESEAAG